MEKYFTKLNLLYKNSDEERKCSELLFNDINLSFGDQRLNNIAALTYNSQACDKIFAILEKTIIPTDNPWKTIYKSLLILHTIICFGSEKAIDSSIQISRFIYPLQEYNSALVKKGLFSMSGRTDYGAPVRAESKIIIDILRTDDTIRSERSKARNGQDSLVPVGDLILLDDSINQKPQHFFGQGLDKSLGAKFSMEEVPGVYAGRPDRYFDNPNDPRSRGINTGDHQFTRDAMAPDLLDLTYDAVGSTDLPEAQYIPGLEKQKELERKLRQQQEELQQLQSVLAQQQQSHLFMSNLSSTAPVPVPSNDLFGLSSYNQSAFSHSTLMQIQMPISTPPIPSGNLNNFDVNTISSSPHPQYPPINNTTSLNQNYGMNGHAQQQLQPQLSQPYSQYMNPAPIVPIYSNQSQPQISSYPPIYSNPSPNMSIPPSNPYMNQSSTVVPPITYQQPILDSFSPMSQSSGMYPQSYSSSQLSPKDDHGDTIPSYAPPPPPPMR